jgi:hypothetical protein
LTTGLRAPSDTASAWCPSTSPAGESATPPWARRMTGAARTEAHDTRGRYVIIGGQGSCTSGAADLGHVDYPVFHAAHATPVRSVSLPGGRARRNAYLRHHLDIDVDPLSTLWVTTASPLSGLGGRRVPCRGETRRGAADGPSAAVRRLDSVQRSCNESTAVGGREWTHPDRAFPGHSLGRRSSTPGNFLRLTGRLTVTYPL